MIIMKNALTRISRAISGIVFPGLRYSQYIYEDTLREQVNENTVWLDLGCGHQILPEWRKDREKELVETCRSITGIDADAPSLQQHDTITDLVRGDITDLPFRDNSFNLITANMVLEHVERPLSLFKEIHRILMPGGKFVFHTPNIYGYNTVAACLLPEFLKPFLVTLLHGRREEDRFPAFYRCNAAGRIRNLIENSGLRLGRLRYILSSPQFYICPPLILLELLYLRVISLPIFRKLRINILAVIEKAEAASGR